MGDELIVAKAELKRALLVTRRNVRRSGLIVATGLVAIAAAAILRFDTALAPASLLLYGGGTALFGTWWFIRARKSFSTVSAKLLAQELPAARLLRGSE